MGAKPVIGVTMSRDFPGGFPRDGLRMAYAEALRRWGALPLPLLNATGSVELLSLCDGLLLTGGGDFHPDLFHRPDEGTDWAGWSAERDGAELALMDEAAHQGMPMFGICRGVQSLAVGFGGTIVQDIPRKMPHSKITHSQHQPRRRTTHTITVQPGTRLARILTRVECEVNSFHHQSVDDAPPGWVVAARAPDGVVEAIERPGDPFVLGVQWHPEDLWGQDAGAARLFEEFVNAAVSYRRLKEQHGGRSN